MYSYVKSDVIITIRYISVLTKSVVIYSFDYLKIARSKAMEKQDKTSRAGERPGAFTVLEKIISQIMINNNPPRPNRPRVQS